MTLLKKINLNDEIYVGVNDKTFETIENSLPFTEKSDIESYMEHVIKRNLVTVDGKEYIKMQLWDAMSTFGSHMYLGAELVIDPNILIEIENGVD